TVADNAEGLARQLLHGMVQQTEHVTSGPAPFADITGVVQQLAGQGEDQTERMLDNSRTCIFGDVRDADTPGAGGLEVDIIETGSGNGDELQRRRLAEVTLIQNYLVDQRNVLALQSGRYLFRAGCVPAGQLVYDVCKRLEAHVAHSAGIK